MSLTIDLNWPSFQVDTSQVQVYLKANLPSYYDGLLAYPDRLTVLFKSDYADNDLSVVNTYWSSLTSTTFAPTMQQIIANKIQSAQIFGQKLLLQIEIDNVLAGLTIQEVTQMLDDYSTLISMLSTGSIPTALVAAQNLQPLDGMTQNRIDGYIVQIKTYLGIPL